MRPRRTLRNAIRAKRSKVLAGLQPTTLKQAETQVAIKTIKHDRAIRNLNKNVKARITYLDNVPTGSPISVLNVAQFFHLNAIPQGSNVGNRDGNIINMLWFNLRATLYSGDPSGNVMRVLIMYDKQTNGATPSEADVFAPTGDPTAMRFWNSQQRYVFLYDKMIALDVNKPSTINFTKRLNKKTNYGNSAVGTIANVVTGGLFLVVISDSNATPNPSIMARVRLVYEP